MTLLSYNVICLSGGHFIVPEQVVCCIASAGHHRSGSRRLGLRRRSPDKPALDAIFSKTLGGRKLQR